MTTVSGPHLMRWDEVADEPYLVLPSFPDLRLTPWRAGDEDDVMRLFNEPEVGMFAHRRPYPYLREHLPFFSDVLGPSSRKTIDNVLRPLLHDTPTSAGHINYSGAQCAFDVPYYPCIMLRHYPSGKLIGDLRLFQAEDSAGGDQNAGFAGQAQQTAQPSEQVWEIAYNLMPEWRGKGVAGQMLDVIMAGWVEWLGIGTGMAGVQTVNTASAGLLASRGFTKGTTFMEPWPEEKGGGEREVAKWTVTPATYRSRLAL